MIQVSRGPYPGREDIGDDEDYTELLRAAYERLEPDLRSRKALLMNKRVGSKVRMQKCWVTTHVTLQIPLEPNRTSSHPEAGAGSSLHCATNAVSLPLDSISATLRGKASENYPSARRVNTVP